MTGSPMGPAAMRAMASPAGSTPSAVPHPSSGLHADSGCVFPTQLGAFADTSSSTFDMLRWYSFQAGAVYPKAAVSQTVFAAYPCWSGTQNVPPSFVPALDPAPAAAPSCSPPGPCLCAAPAADHGMIC